MKAIGNNFLVEPQKEDRTKSGIILDLKPKPKNIGVPVSIPSDDYDIGDNDLLFFKTSNVRPYGDGEVVPASEVVGIYKNGKTTIDNLVIPSNYVLVEITHDPSKVNVAGQELYIETKYNKEFHAPTYGVVRTLPNKLVCHAEAIHASDNFEEKRELASESMPWTTDIEIEVGDTVHFDYLQQSVCIRDKLVIFEGSKRYFLIHYSQLYAAERKGEIRMLNGFMAVSIKDVEKVQKIGSNGLLIVDPRPADKLKNFGEGRVEFVGTPNRQYVMWNVDERLIDISVGDEIVFKASKRSKFGQDMHINSEKLKGLYRVQKKDVHFVK